jgi:hypothetical protein
MPNRPIGRRVNAICKVQRCNNVATAHELCAAHRWRKQKKGDVQADTPVRRVAGTGYVNHGYRIVPVPPELRHLTNGETGVGEHRLVMAIAMGRPLRPDESVHHKNGDRLCNELSNLELWSRWQPSGGRVTDKLDWAREFMRQYAPEELAENILF